MCASVATSPVLSDPHRVHAQRRIQNITRPLWVTSLSLICKECRCVFGTARLFTLPSFSHLISCSVHLPTPQLYYHLYQPPLPHISSHNPQQLALHSFFISPTLREDLQKRAEALVPVDGLDIPGYFSLVALDTPTHPSTNPKQHQQIDQSAQQSGLGLFGVRNWVYKAVSEKDGKPYIVRRLENFKLPNDQALSVVEKWRRIRHPNLVHVREAFTTRAFGDPCQFPILPYLYAF